MKHLLSCLALLCLATSIFADDCNNPLLAALGIAGLNQPETATGFQYCKSLQNKQSCCSASVINGIQDSAQKFALDMKEVVAARDRLLVDARENVLPALQTNLQRLKDALQKVTAQLAQIDAGDFSYNGVRAYITGRSNTIEGFYSGITELRNFAGNVGSIQQGTEAIFLQLSTIKSDFNDYQKSRTSCMLELIKLQSSARCLACDPTYASKGVSGTTVTMSDRVCKRLQSACYNYITKSVTQSRLLSVKYSGVLIGALATLFEGVANGDSSVVMINGFDSLIPADIPELSMSATWPDPCTADNCPWICKTLFKNAEMDGAYAVVGGAPKMSLPSAGARRVLVQEDEPVVQIKLQEKKRILQSGTWDPDQDDAGVTVTIEDDPAGVANKRSGLIKMSLICMVGMLVALLL